MTYEKYQELLYRVPFRVRLTIRFLFSLAYSLSLLFISGYTTEAFGKKLPIQANESLWIWSGLLFFLTLVIVSWVTGRVLRLYKGTPLSEWVIPVDHYKEVVWREKRLPVK